MLLEQISGGYSDKMNTILYDFHILLNHSAIVRQTISWLFCLRSRWLHLASLPNGRRRGHSSANTVTGLGSRYSGRSAAVKWRRVMCSGGATSSATVVVNGEQCNVRLQGGHRMWMALDVPGVEWTPDLDGSTGQQSYEDQHTCGLGTDEEHDTNCGEQCNRRSD